jgi:hypothetical protein
MRHPPSSPLGFLRRACAPLAWMVGAAVAAPSSAAPPPFTLDRELLERDTALLAAGPHRLAGSAEYHRAADQVERRLREIGIAEVFSQPFAAPQLATREAFIELAPAAGTGGAARRLPIVPMRPNGIVPPATPAEGISGELVYVGRARAEDIVRPLEGAIAVLDYESGENWLRVFRHGAAAAIFLASPAADASHQHYVYLPVPIPRYYFEGDPALLLGGGRATVRAAVPWEASEGRNVIAFIPGTAPTFFLDAPEVVVLAVALDSYGNVPERSPGARGAANAAALLQWAEWLHRHPPRRDTLLVFLDHHGRGQAGARHFYRAFLPPASAAAVPRRRASNQRETAFVQRVLALAGEADPLADRTDVARDLVRRLRAVADARTIDLRFLERAELDAAAALPAGPERDAARARAQTYETTRAAWNELKRSLAQRVLHPDAVAPFQEALAEVRERLVLRQAELEVEARGLAADARLQALAGGHQRVLHLTLMAGDAADRWGVLTGNWANTLRNPRDSFAFYAGLLATFDRAAGQLREAGQPLPGFRSFTTDGSLFFPWLFFSGPTFATTGAFAGRLGTPNLALTTGQDRFAREGTPIDTFERLRLDRMAPQFEEMAWLVRATLDADGLSQRSAIARFDHVVQGEFTAGNERFGPRVMVRRPGRSAANEPFAGAIVQFMRQPSQNPAVGPYEFDAFKIPAYDDFEVLRTDVEGAYHLGPGSDHFGATFAFAAGFDERGLLRFASSNDDRNRAHSRLNLFPARTAWIVPPPQLIHGNTEPFNAATNARLDNKRAFFRHFDGVFVTHFDDRVPAVKLVGQESFALLNLAPVPGLEEADRGFFRRHRDYGFGEGIAGRPGEAALAVAPRAAQDLLALSDFRLALLRSHGVRNPAVEDLHLLSRDLLERVDETEKAWRREALGAGAHLVQRRVYRETLSSLQDMVRAVLALLLLAIPFAYALERLLIGSTSIYRQTLGFSAFFAGTFLLLYATHPAFSVSAAPLVIFLGFAIVLLAGMVIALIMGKFERELKTLQGQAATLHAADVSRLGTMLAAVHMGISTMRRRPMRTALTAVTVVLLTFTLLTFSSFGSQLGIVQLYRGAAPAYSAAAVHRASWGTLNEGLLDLVRGRWADEAIVAPRYWVTRDWNDPTWKTSTTGILASDVAQERIAVLNGVLGLSVGELQARADFLAALGLAQAEPLGDRVWMTANLAASLGLAPGEAFQLGGRTLRVGGLLTAEGILGLVDMGGNSVLPVDLAIFDPGQVSNEAEDPGETQSWQYLPVDSVVLADNAIARALGGTLRLVHLYTEDPHQSAAIGEELAKFTGADVLATRPDGVYRHVFGTVLQAGGLRSLLLPLVLGGLVIFGTLLGSVADREREIYTFSALGLAPRHVATLFFAEALVFATVGGVGGYLLAQAVAKGLNALATAGLVAPIELNYSSFAAIATLVVVMLVVLASAVYPAMKASRSANPGILRHWRLPEPRGDRWEIVFPFTVSAHDITGVASFLQEHFLNYTDTGMGNFLCGGCRLVAQADGTPAVEAELALAPFDLGVTETFRLEARPSEIPGIDEVHILLERRSGQHADWRRLNRVLVDDLRRQFLLWRALPRETMEAYRLRTLAQLAAPAKAEEAAAPVS